MDLHGIFHNTCYIQRSLNIKSNYIFHQGSIRMAPDKRAGLFQKMNDLCNQICKGGLASRMHTDKPLLGLDTALRTLNLKLWGIAEDPQQSKRAQNPYLFKSEPGLRETDPSAKSKHWCVFHAKGSVLLSMHGSLSSAIHVGCPTGLGSPAWLMWLLWREARRAWCSSESWVLLAGALPGLKQQAGCFAHKWEATQMLTVTF